MVGHRTKSEQKHQMSTISENGQPKYPSNYTHIVVKSTVTYTESMLIYKISQKLELKVSGHVLPRLIIP